jgi:uncharacterized protein YggU (UPF0235/DUF167 family)
MLLRVQVKPDAKKESIKESSEGVFEITVKVEAERNQANIQVRELLAQWYNVPVGKIQIKTGHKSPRKTVELLPI